MADSIIGGASLPNSPNPQAEGQGIPQLSEALAQARAKALSDGANEICAIAQALRFARDHQGVDHFDALLTGALLRIELLSTCVAILGDSRTDAEEIGIQYEFVTGNQLEVSHV